MGLKKAENQVKILLAETILSMCRNTLNYHAEICVEGLLGITLDNEEIFLVNINQTIKNQVDTASKAALPSKESLLKRVRRDDEGSESDPESSSNESGEGESLSSSKKRRKRARRKKHKGGKSGSESDENADESTNADTSVLQNDGVEQRFVRIDPDQTDPSEQYYDNSNQTAGDDSCDNEGVPSGVTVTVKQEPPGGDSDDDLVFVKQEVDDFNMSQPSVHQFSNLNQVFGNSSADTSLSQPSDFMSGAFFGSPANNMSANAMQQPVPGPSGANPGLEDGVRVMDRSPADSGLIVVEPEEQQDASSDESEFKHWLQSKMRESGVPGNDNNTETVGDKTRDRYEPEEVVNVRSSRIVGKKDGNVSGVIIVGSERNQTDSAQTGGVGFSGETASGKADSQESKIVEYESEIIGSAGRQTGSEMLVSGDVNAKSVNVSHSRTGKHNAGIASYSKDKTTEVPSEPQMPIIGIVRLVSPAKSATGEYGGPTTTSGTGERQDTDNLDPYSETIDSIKIEDDASDELLTTNVKSEEEAVKDGGNVNAAGIVNAQQSSESVQSLQSVSQPPALIPQVLTLQQMQNLLTAVGAPVGGLGQPILLPQGSSVVGENQLNTAGSAADKVASTSQYVPNVAAANQVLTMQQLQQLQAAVPAIGSAVVPSVNQFMSPITVNPGFPSWFFTPYIPIVPPGSISHSMAPAVSITSTTMAQMGLITSTMAPQRPITSTVAQPGLLTSTMAPAGPICATTAAVDQGAVSGAVSKIQQNLPVSKTQQNLQVQSSRVLMAKQSARKLPRQRQPPVKSCWTGQFTKADEGTGLEQEEIELSPQQSSPDGERITLPDPKILTPYPAGWKQLDNVPSDELVAADTSKPRATRNRHFPTTEEFANRRVSSRLTKKLYCQSCKRHIVGITFEEHMQTVHKVQVNLNDEVTCNFCQIRFDDLGQLHTHWRSVHKELHVCLKCGVPCGSAVVLALHLPVHDAPTTARFILPATRTCKASTSGESTSESTSCETTPCESTPRESTPRESPSCESTPRELIPTKRTNNTSPVVSESDNDRPYVMRHEIRRTTRTTGGKKYPLVILRRKLYYKPDKKDPEQK